MPRNKNVCPGCLEGLYKGNHELVTIGIDTWHKDCFDKLQADRVKGNDRRMFQRLNRAFNKVKL